MQAAAPAAEYCPAAHATHFVMPVLAANVPAAQFCASALRNQKPLKRNNNAHCTPAGDGVDHTLHRPAAFDPKSWLYVPVGHASQAALDVDPVLVLYVPAGHSVHATAEVEPVRSL